jgi:hypothetical protein
MSKTDEQILRNTLAIMEALASNWHTHADHGGTLRGRIAETEAILFPPHDPDTSRESASRGRRWS